MLEVKKLNFFQELILFFACFPLWLFYTFFCDKIEKKLQPKVDYKSINLKRIIK